MALVLGTAVSACDEGALPPEPFDDGATLSAAPVLSNASDVAALASAAAVAGVGNPIPGRWIVVFNPSVSDAPGLARALAAQHGTQATFTYSSALKGFAAPLSDAAVAALRNNPNVAYVEQDQVVQATDTQTNPTWGLDRIDQASLPLDNGYTYDNSGSGVEAHVLDTGIRITHNEFGGRATFGADFIGDGNHMVNNGDCGGHGTHVAGTIGGSTYGVAKSVSLIAVRVLNCSGSGSYAGVIGGIDWVVNNRSGPAVANMSLSGGRSTSLNQAVENAIAAGVVFAVAAGNDNTDACTRSPASAGGALTVGATTSSDNRSGFSNFGTCVDLFAPGSSITSSTNSGDNSTGTWNGTSMATPHVAGVAALIRSDNSSLSAAQVTQMVVQNATSGVLSGIGTGSPDLLLYSGLGGTPPVPPPPTDTPAHVDAITVTATYGKRNANGTAVVRVKDDSGTALPGATVIGDWKVNGAVVKTGTLGSTDGSGDATITSGGLRRTTSADLIEFCVTNVTGSGLVYDSGTNVETCDAAASAPAPPPPSGFTLTVRVRKNDVAELAWSGSSASSFVMVRTNLDNGTSVTETVAGSTHTDDPPAGRWGYQVCETASGPCTNSVEVTTRK